jgi:hypothetical protein
MKRNILINCIIVLISFILIEYIIFTLLDRRYLEVQGAYSISHNYNKDTTFSENPQTDVTEYGYGDIMDVLYYEKNLKILRMEKGNKGDNTIGIGFELVGTEEEFKTLSSSLSSMKNFCGINRINVKSGDDGIKNIQFYTEFKISYGK